MDWTPQQITLGKRRFEAKVHSGLRLDVEEIHRTGVTDAHKHGDAWFVRRVADRKFPTEEMLNGVPLYRYESVPDELWHIKSCSLQESIEIARQHFGFPELKHCRHGETSRSAIWAVLEAEKLADRLMLSVVTEICLTFELLPGARSLTRSEAKRIMDFCLAEFREGSSAKERAMLIRGAVETGAFAVGSV